MKNLMTAVVTALFALFALSTGVAFAAEPSKKEAVPVKAAASAPEKAASKAGEKAEKAEPMKKKDKKGGC